MNRLLWLTVGSSLSIALALLVLNTVMVSYASTNPCQSLQVVGPTSAIVPAGSTTNLQYNVSWSYMPSGTMLTFSTSISPGWTVTLNMTTMTVSGTGWHNITASVTAPTTVGVQGSLTVNATDGVCASKLTTAAQTTGFATTPEFGAGILALLAVGIIAIMALRQQSLRPRTL